ncbi:uncharacterized protein MalAC0309_0613 [Microcella alkaliphila]|uniref:Uncharacterized protein n=1 Tax=Microcella alkaliphila TaxID=279828 RepID=A0A0U5BKV3_9MICO|nr:uncharacterized protein MalAC0309_0613 [Microcella alkaliphila]
MPELAVDARLRRNAETGEHRRRHRKHRAAALTHWVPPCDAMRARCNSDTVRRKWGRLWESNPATRRRRRTGNAPSGNYWIAGRLWESNPRPIHYE